MDFDQAVAILLQYDVMPSQLLDAGQRGALKCAKDVVADHAKRAVSAFLNHEISKKYVSRPITAVRLTPEEVHDAITAAARLKAAHGGGLDKDQTKLVVINEVHDHHHENDLA
jgi:hypothetical protein